MRPGSAARRTPRRRERVHFPGWVARERLLDRCVTGGRVGLPEPARRGAVDRCRGAVVRAARRVRRSRRPAGDRRLGRDGRHSYDETETSARLAEALDLEVSPHPRPRCWTGRGVHPRGAAVQAPRGHVGRGGGVGLVVPVRPHEPQQARRLHCVRGSSHGFSRGICHSFGATALPPVSPHSRCALRLPASRARRVFRSATSRSRCLWCCFS